MRKALIIGIDDYPQHPLSGCVSDAIELATLFETHGNGDPNFDVKRLTSDSIEITAELLQVNITELFANDADIVVLYFAGHGIIEPATNSGFIVSSDGKKGSWGMSLQDILGIANKAHPNIKSTVIILDCCHSGYVGEISGVGNDQVSVIGTGVTILTASHRNGQAAEGNGHGIFTDILLDGLKGGCADIRGNITPAALYSHVDQTLGPWEQRPIYKANVQNFIALRQVEPKVSPSVLRNLPKYFPDPSSVFPLDPSYEPDRNSVPEKFRHLPVNESHVAIFRELQQCNRHGLVIPVDADHMFYAAIDSKGCKLTALGAHYRNLAEKKRI
ncbi:peptidase C14 caspase catalytic subunit p20 [Klebsiella variicola]|uniref:caspase family protein n=1 Tax=Klebsiella variicola TaxID=244366 RepID=UPI000BA16639|nr:caspase family protein [Klebsiella variicola]OZM20373.1 peptidase C14 caspase catalytic subunit p20 [Klebsiella variicola]HAT7732682.1 caspase family protein [Enterobacter cloacae]